MKYADLLANLKTQLRSNHVGRGDINQTEQLIHRYQIEWVNDCDESLITELCLLHADLLLLKEDTKGAEDIFRAILTTTPNDPRTLLGIADVCLYKGCNSQCKVYICSAVSVTREAGDAKMLLKSLDRLAFYEMLEENPASLPDIFKEMCAVVESITCASDLLMGYESIIEEGYGSLILEYLECVALVALRLKSGSVLSILLQYIIRIYQQTGVSTEMVQSRLNDLLAAGLSDPDNSQLTEEVLARALKMYHKRMETHEQSTFIF